MTQASFDFKPYIIVDSDTRTERLTKIRNFLIQLKEHAPKKFNYSSYVQSVNLSRNKYTGTDNYYYDIVKPLIKEPILHSPRVQDSVRDRAFNDQECGTCACVAGWCVILSNCDKPFQTHPDATHLAFSGMARAILKLSLKDGEFLFYGHSGYGERSLRVYDDHSADIDAAIHRINILLRDQA
jgi:hypothetical protein